MVDNLRIVQIGFNRAGTSSIADFLRRAGFAVVDHRFDLGRYKGQFAALVIEENIREKRAPLFGLDAWNGFTDLEYLDEKKSVYAQYWFREIAHAHPETKFILNLRYKEDWLKSRRNFGGYLKTCAKALAVPEAEVTRIWSAQWDAHIEAVKHDIPSDRLLILDIDSPDERALNRFVGSLKFLRLRQKNKAPRGPLSKILSHFTPQPVRFVFPQPFRNWLKNY